MRSGRVIGVATLCAVTRSTEKLKARRRGVLAALATVAAATSLVSGCAAGFDATSLQPYAPADGVYAESGEIRALNVLVVAADGATDGVVLMTIANDGRRDDRLVGIEADAGSVEADTPLTLPAGGTVAFGGPEAEASATVTDLQVQPGQTIELRLTFARAEPLSVRTVVMPATGDYEGITPTPEATFTSTPTASA